MEKTKILVLCDDLWHPAEIIERGLAAFPDERFSFDIVKTAKDILTPEWIRQFPMIICCKSGSVNAANNAPWFEPGVTEVMPKEFDEYVREGHGFLAIHSGLAYGKYRFPEYNQLVGCMFLRHPPRCTVEVTVSDEKHQISSGVGSFCARDEHYMIEMQCEDAEIFLTSSSEKGGIQPAGYTRKLGNGRLCALTPGHTLEVWNNPQFQKLLSNAIDWCLEK